MTFLRYSALSSLVILTHATASLAQQPPTTPAAPAVAPAAPAVAPRAAVPPAVVPPVAPTPGGVPDTNTVQPRESPAVKNPVAEAFTPQTGGLTANDVAKRAIASSNSIAAKNAELRAAAAKVDSAMYQFLPRVTLKAGYTRLSRVETKLGGDGFSLGASSGSGYHMAANPDPTTANDIPQVLVDGNGNPVQGGRLTFPVITNSYSLSASLTVPLSDYVLRMSQSIEGTKLNRESAELLIKAERAKVEGDARVAYFNWVRAIGQVAVTEKSIDRVKARLKDAEAAFTVGLVTKAEVLRLQSLVATTEAGLETAKAFRELSAQQLASIMDDKKAEYTLGEDVLAQPAVRPIEPLDQLVSEAQQKRLELQSLTKTTQSLEKAESVVRSNQYPRLDGFADYTYANPNQRYMFQKAWNATWSAGVQLSWTINDLLTNRSSGDEIKANRETIEANRKTIAQGIRMEVTSAYTDGRRATAELEAAKRATEASQAAYDTSIQLYKVGKATTAELIDSEAELVNANLRLINAHIDTKVAETKLARAVGRDLTKVGN